MWYNVEQQRSLGKKSSSYKNVIPGSADSQPEASNRRVKSEKSSTAKMHFVIVLICESFSMPSILQK